MRRWLFGTVADTIIKNVRSQHILDKLGFEFVLEEGDFKYYKLEKKKWLKGQVDNGY